MSNHEKESPVVKNVPFLTDELRRQIAAVKANAKQNPNMFPGCGKLGEQLTEQAIKAQAKQVDELPLMSQAEMLSVLLTCHEMLAQSMQQLTETMAAVMELQKEQGE